MNELTLIKYLNARLLKKMPRLDVENVPDDLISQRKLLRALMNVCPTTDFDENFLFLQDKLLSEEVLELEIRLNRERRIRKRRLEKKQKN